MNIRTGNDIKEFNAAEDHDEQLGIFTTSYEDEMTMMRYFEKIAA